MAAAAVISAVASLYDIDDEREGIEFDSEKESTDRPANTDEVDAELDTATESSSADDVKSLLLLVFRAQLFASNWRWFGSGMKIWLADLLLIDSDTEMWHELDELDE